jgi:hypothetical protein
MPSKRQEVSLSADTECSRCCGQGTRTTDGYDIDLCENLVVDEANVRILFGFDN